jgi:hypothetical protein
MNSSGKGEFYRWHPAACLAVSGEDSARFLQGQITNDLHKTSSEEAVYGLWLNQKGKVLADSFVQRLAGQEFRIVSYFSPTAVIRERLEAYIIADDVVIEDLTDKMAGITVMNGAMLGQLPVVAGRFTGRRMREPHTEVIYPVATAPEMIANLSSFVERDAEEMLRRRIAARIPAVPIDIGPTDLPNEGGLDADAVSYTKGCYLGQEVMARLKSMGQVRRRLLAVSGTGATPPVPAALFQQGRRVGELRSVVRDGSVWIGLAMISLLHVTRAEGVGLAADGPAVIQLAEDPATP